MSSIPFNPSMLTASPSPSPEPEERLQDEGNTSVDDATLDEGNTSVDDATLDDATPKEPQETVADRICQSWAVTLSTMHVSVKTSPPPKLELLEDQESWLHAWEQTMGDMSSLFDQARATEVHLSLSDAEAVDLAGGKATTKTLYKAVKAVEPAPTARQVRLEKEKALEASKMVEKAATTEVIDMGCPRLGGRITTTPVITHPDVLCTRCASTDTPCVLVNGNLRCKGCTKAKKGCSFVGDKAKERMPAAPKPKMAAPKVKTPVPAPAPKGKTPPPVAGPVAGSVTDTVPNVGSSDVEIVGESTVDEDATVGGKTIVVQHVKRPLASRPTPAPKCPRLDLAAQLDESRIEAAQLWIRNAELEAEVAKWKGVVVDMRQHSRMQEAEVMAMSNRIYCMGRDWGVRMCFSLVSLVGASAPVLWSLPVERHLVRLMIISCRVQSDVRSNSISMSKSVRRPN
ncbi:hypothetical protein C8R48DRAFT_768852 [Suillus tomentosus]|nr:hypothetical protein C8R48DRAFT_768852 [Suillus tomentosus]